MHDRSPSLFLVVLTSVFLAGCSGNGLDARLKEYNNRLARVLDQEMPILSAKASPKFPDKRDLYLEIASEQIDLLDFLRLGDCELQSVIADKNSSLGRFAMDSVVLRQDITFIRLGRACVDSLDDLDLKEKLEGALIQKRAHLKRRLWNALFAGPEYREFWTQVTGGYPSNIESRLEYALNDLQLLTANIGDGSSTLEVAQQDANIFDPETFEQALMVLRGGEAGALLRSWHHVAINLRLATEILKLRVERKPLCYPDMSNPKAQYFRNLVVGKFAGELQKDIAILNRRYYEVIEPLRLLEQSFAEVETSAYRSFRLERDAFFKAARAEVTAHVDGLQPLMLQCGFLTQAP